MLAIGSVLESDLLLLLLLATVERLLFDGSVSLGIVAATGLDGRSTGTRAI